MTSTKRNTWQRAAIRDFLSSTGDFKTAQQVHAELRAVGDKIGLATVYRALQQMAEDDELDMMRTAEGEAAYRACTPGHHHHLICRDCSYTVEIEAQSVEDWAESIASSHGFTKAGHDLEIFGLCSNCSTS